MLRGKGKDFFFFFFLRYRPPEIWTVPVFVGLVWFGRGGGKKEELVVLAKRVGVYEVLRLKLFFFFFFFF